jgi:hypothetical protein
MTTLVAINTRDSIIMGADSYGTVTRQILDPNDLAEYFETGKGHQLKLGPEGKPLLRDWSNILNKAQNIPSNNYEHVEKIFSLAPLEMGVMSSGVAALGDRSLTSLFREFSSSKEAHELKNTAYTLFNVGERLLIFLWEHYSRIFADEPSRPDLELMLCGYDKGKFTPGMVRIHVQDYKVFVPDYDFCVFFGGITKEIQRLVFGTDMYNKMRLIDRSKEVLNRYYELLLKQLEANGNKTELAKPEDFGDELDLFHNWRLEGLTSNWSSFSDQTAIDCIDFLINIMIRSQQFSTQIPSVGGDVQIALVKKNSGFHYISKREWRHGEHTMPIFD